MEGFNYLSLIPVATASKESGKPELCVATGRFNLHCLIKARFVKAPLHVDSEKVHRIGST